MFTAYKHDLCKKYFVIARINEFYHRLQSVLRIGIIVRQMRGQMSRRV